MTREIKFRAWDKLKRMMCEVSEIDFNEGVVECCVGEPRGDIWIAKLSDVELMQYTGLNDKYGVEIYEGDIITNLEDTKAVVIYYDGVFCCVNPNVLNALVPRRNLTSRDIIWSICFSDYVMEPRVKGNIYENPERLTKEM